MGAFRCQSRQSMNYIYKGVWIHFAEYSPFKAITGANRNLFFNLLLLGLWVFTYIAGLPIYQGHSSF